MVSKAGAGLKSLQTLLRIIQFLAALLILGIFSWFIARLAINDLPRDRWVTAVEVIAAAAVLYTLFAVILTCFLGGIAAFGFLAVLLDLLFLGAFIAVAVLTRAGKRSCRGFRNTPIGDGNIPESARDIANRFGYGQRAPSTYRPNIRRACQLQRAAFIVSIILIGLFLISAILQMLLVKQHKKDKRYGPGPSNDYTTGSGKKGGFFARKPKNHTRDAELATVGAAAPVVAEKYHHNNTHANNNIRPSHDTGYTASTVVSPDPYGVNKYNNNPANTTPATTVPVNPGFTGPAPHGVGPLHNYATTGATY